MAEKILIVDDSRSMRQMTSMILKGAGYEVLEATNADEALEKLDSGLTAVITDYNMPGMNGVELIKKIRGGSDANSVPILMLTTESEQEKKNAGKSAGATGWLTKPFDQDRLLGAVKKITKTVEF
jgi:two-component system chemotaxis response regulator CheY